MKLFQKKDKNYITQAQYDEIFNDTFDFIKERLERNNCFEQLACYRLTKFAVSSSLKKSNSEVLS